MDILNQFQRLTCFDKIYGLEVIDVFLSNLVIGHEELIFQKRYFQMRVLVLFEILNKSQRIVISRKMHRFKVMADFVRDQVC